MNPRDVAPLGRTGLAVTRLGLGTAPLGGLFTAVSDEEGHAVVRRAWDAGLRLFDTAPLYGHGLAERRLGHVLRDVPREELVLSTKVGRLLRADAPPEPRQAFAGVPPVNPVFDFSYDGVMRSFEESLERLGLERVDVLLIHDPDRHHDEALGGAYRALDQLRSDGLVRAIGAGMNQVEMLARFAREADFDCFLVAGRYTLLDQPALRELLPLCLERGIAVIAGGAFNSGILADPGPDARYDYAPAGTGLIERARRLESVCRRHRTPLRAAAMHFPLAHPAVAAVVVGCRSVAELDANVAAFEAAPPPALWQELKAEGLLPETAPTP